MNRRTAIRKAFSIGVATAAVPVLAKAAEAHQNVLGNQCSPAPTYTPPPPDTRTPEQVLADQDAEILRDHIQHLTRTPDQWSRRYAYRTDMRGFKRIKAHLAEQKIPHELRVVNGLECIIGSNGNITHLSGQ